MATSTAGTYLKYGIQQVETATVVAPSGITSTGNAIVTITSSAISASPVEVTVGVVKDDSEEEVSKKIYNALSAESDLTDVFYVERNGVDIVLRKIRPVANDLSLNIAIENDTCAGITDALTSSPTRLGSAFTSLASITGYPDLGATPNKLDATDLSALESKESIFGLQDIPDLTFECNYNEDAYSTIDSMTDEYTFLLEFNDAGEDGMFIWNGHVSIYVVGGGVDEVRKMTLVCSAESEIEML